MGYVSEQNVKNMTVGQVYEEWLENGKLIFTRMPGGWFVSHLSIWQDSLGAEHRVMSTTFVREKDLFPESF